MTPARLTSFLGGNLKLSCIFRDWGDSSWRNLHSPDDSSVQKTVHVWIMKYSWKKYLGTKKSPEIGLALKHTRNWSLGILKFWCEKSWFQMLRMAPLIILLLLLFLNLNTTSYVAHTSPTYGCFKFKNSGGAYQIFLGQVASSFASTHTTTNSYTHIHSSDLPCAVTPSRI